jgi:hypothetical protein
MIEWITEKYMIPDSKIETNHLFWDTSPKSPGAILPSELNPFKLPFQSQALPRALPNILSA